MTIEYWGWKPKENQFDITSFVDCDFVITRELVDLLDVLPNSQKEVIILFYFKDLSVQEISENLNLSESTVRSRLRLAKEKLKEWIATAD